MAVPAFSRVQSDPERLARYYLRTANLIMWISAPIFGFLFVAAEPVIVLALGRRWRGAAPVFQILAIFALGQLLLESTLWLFVSRGQSQRLLKLLLVISPIIDRQLRDWPAFRHQGRGLVWLPGFAWDFPLDTEVQFSRHEFDIAASWAGYLCTRFQCASLGFVWRNSRCI